MDNFKPEKKYAPMEVADDTLVLVSGGTDNYAEVIPDRTNTGNIVVTEDVPETMMPVGAITEA